MRSDTSTRNSGDCSASSEENTGRLKLYSPVTVTRSSATDPGIKPKDSFVTIGGEQISGSNDLGAIGIETPPTSPTLDVPSIQNVPPEPSRDKPYTLAPHSVNMIINQLITKRGSDFSPEDSELNNAIIGTCVHDNGNEFLQLCAVRHEKLYVRPCYRDIYSILDAKWRGEVPLPTRAKRCAFITGTPGIGKSVFIHFLANILMKRSKPVLLLYKDEGDGLTTLFWQGSGWIAHDHIARLFLNDVICSPGLISNVSSDLSALEIWSVADTQIPMGTWKTNRICVSSPGCAAMNFNVLKRWVKNNNAITLVMPACDWNEIFCIRQAQLGDSAEQESSTGILKKRFLKWGGVPRTIIFRTEEISLNENKFRGLKVKDVLPFLGTYALEHPRHSGGIFHLVPNFQLVDKAQQATLLEKYSENPAFWWASEQLEREAWNKFRRENEADVINFIDTLANDSVVRGKAWENQIHHLIESVGIQGTLKNLDTGEIENFSIPRHTASFFESFGDIDSSAEYWRPIHNNHKASDSYIPSDGLLLQMTVSNDHRVQISGLEEALESKIFKKWEDENPDKTLRLIFIIHPSVLAQFTKQTYKYADNSEKGISKPRARQTVKMKEKRMKRVEDSITQYALSVDLEARLRTLLPGRKRELKNQEERTEENRTPKRRRTRNEM